MAKWTITALKHLLVRTGSVLTLVAFMLIAAGFFYLSLGVNKELVEKYLSEQIKRPVQIESIDTGWGGLYAKLGARGISVQRNDGSQSSLRLRELGISLDPLYLLTGRFQVERIIVDGLTLEILRHSDGTIQVGDFVIGNKDGTGPNILDWLLRQRYTEIRKGKIVWQDRREPDRKLAITAINARTRRINDATRFTGSITPPATLGNQIHIKGTLRGDSFAERSWAGNINASIPQLSLSHLPLILQEVLPWKTKGMMDADVQSRWKSGQINRADVALEISQFDIPVNKRGDKVPVEKFTGSIAFEYKPESWRLTVDDPEFHIDGDPLGFGRLEVHRSNNEQTYFAEVVQVDALNRIFDEKQYEWPWLDRLRKIRPQGEIRNLKIASRGSFLPSSDWRVEGEFSDFAWAPLAPFPGVSGLSGSALVGPNSGRIHIRSQGVNVNSPDAFEQSIFLDKLNADIGWRKDNNSWRVRFNNMEVNNADLKGGEGNVVLRLARDDYKPLYVDAEFTLNELGVEKLANYLPRGVVPRKTIDWFEKALLEGRFSDSTISVVGDLRKFPFREGGGFLAVTTKVLNGKLHYADRWPAVDKVYGNLSISNVALHAEISSAEIENSKVQHGTVSSDDIFARSKELTIDARLNAPAASVVQFLTEGPLVKQKSQLNLAATGGGELDLDIFLPLKDLKTGLKVSGQYAVNDTGLTVADRFQFEDLSGVIDFTDSTIEATGIVGKLMGGEVSIDLETIEPQRPPIWMARGHGHIDSAQLMPLLGNEAIQKRVSGQTSWSGSLTVEPGSAVLKVNSELEGVDITLPKPLNKHAQDSVASSLSAKFKREAQSFGFELGPLLGQLEYQQGKQGLKLGKGVLVLGKKQVGTLPNRGVRIEILEPVLDLDKWFGLLTQDESAKEKRRGTFQTALSEIEMKVDRLHFLARDWGKTFVKASSPNGLEWTAWLSGESAVGNGSVVFNDNNQPSQYTLEFERLHWPKAASQTLKARGPVNPRSYPNLDIRANRFRFGDWNLGRLQLSTTGYVGRWSIDRLNMEQPGLHIKANGHWAYGERGSGTDIRATVLSDDIAIALDRLQLPPHIAEASASLELVLRWPGDPQRFTLADLGGGFDVAAGEGRFLNVEPGTGRLLGLFNIDTISRRFDLDFSDIFSKGLTFDHIKGQGTISKGDLHSEGLFVVGPSAAIEINGRAGLESEDYDLEVVVVPQLGTHISILSALANPLAGAMVFLAQKVMQNTFNKLLTEVAHFKYDIEGSWEEPVITLVQRDPIPDEDRAR
ncbi:MAG: YhdP family protein [Arenicellales bacterium]|nr:YhdP family protein [Arenicellales bacterium]